MEIFKEKPKLDFIGKRYTFFSLSGLLVAASLACLMTRGLNYGIDFTGGSVVQVTFESDIDVGRMRDVLRKIGYTEAIPQKFTGSTAYSIRIKSSAKTFAH